MEWKGGHFVNNAALSVGMSTHAMLMAGMPSCGVFNIATVGNSVIPTVEPRPTLSETVSIQQKRDSATNHSTNCFSPTATALITATSRIVFFYFFTE
jgi:hypothetical protein